MNQKTIEIFKIRELLDKAYWICFTVAALSQQESDKEGENLFKKIALDLDTDRRVMESQIEKSISDDLETQRAKDGE
jgi:hypothetical protein